MYGYEYVLKYGTQIHKCQHPVVGFESEGVKFGKASEDKGVIKSYSDEFELIGNDALFVKNIVIINGYNEIIKFEVYKNDRLKGSSLEYSAQMDLSTIEYGNNRIKFMVKDGGYITYLDNIKNTDRLIKGNTKEITYTGNQYNFDVYLKASEEFEMTYSPNLKNILRTVLIENNDNLEDIRLFIGGANRQVDISVSEKLTNEDCFFISNTQEFLKSIKTNLNINTFTQNNHRVPFPKPPVSAKIKYVYEILAYSNLLEEWATTDTSLIFRNVFVVTQNYRLISRATGQVSNGYIYCNTIANANNMQVDYQNNSNIGVFLDEENKNMKIVINVSMQKMEYTDENGYIFDLLSDVGAGANFKINCIPSVEMKMTFENFYLVKLRHLYCFPLVDVYKRLMADESRSDRPQYNINYDLSKLESSNLYLTSAGMLCSNDELKTTLDKLLRFIYIATGLRQIVDFKDNVYNVRFEKYEDSFKDVEIAKITVEGDIFLNIEAEKIYTDVEVGWNNKDSGIFKSLEYNTLNKFRTQYYNMESKILSLTCDYSASITDIETIVYNAGYNDKTNNVDEIYVFSTYNDNGTLRNIRQSGTLPMVMCSNVSLTPKRLLELHKYELSDLLYHKNTLQYSSTNGKADITFAGIKENDNVTFTDQIMQPFILSFDGVINQSVIKVDANKYGYFTFLYNGQFIRGYIAEGSDSVSVASNGNVSKLRLIVKKNVIL